VRICLAYDCLFPHTIGGAERWYRNLAERLAAQGHDVTYLTLRQWPEGEDPGLPGVRVVPVGPQMELYTRDGRRRIAPPLLFGLGVLRHLWRNGGDYDVVHTASFPYFSVLAAAMAKRRHRFRLFVDWFELWTPDYWRDYLGRLGALGALVQRRCVRVRQRAFCFSRLHEQRLREEGFEGEITRLEGLYAGPMDTPPPHPAVRLVVFAGRHIPEKRVPALVRAVARAREGLPDLRAEIFGDGPERPAVRELIHELGLDDVIDAPGFVSAERIDESFRHALCLVLPSRREGYGLVVVEAASMGTPSVVVADPDNAAAELVAEGENGFIAASAEPDDLAEAILRVHEEGERLRQRTAAWFGQNSRRLSIDNSLEIVLAAYKQDNG
jgi:glycosyltransferase involved in cell wall biosynthesis